MIDGKEKEDLLNLYDHVQDILDHEAMDEQEYYRIQTIGDRIWTVLYEQEGDI